MELTLYQIDAFADKIFQGNPAAVCPLDGWLLDMDLQAIIVHSLPIGQISLIKQSSAPGSFQNAPGISSVN